MKNKYIILDEIEIEIVKNKITEKPLIFNTEKEALNHAERKIDAWQIIEVPYFDEE